jgi:Icc-related predicted phosphoesterase
MRLQVFSDLHVDVMPVRPIAIVPGVDAVVVAGDVCEGAERAFAWLREIVPARIPIITVLGNHTFYRRCLPEELARARDAAPCYGIHLLENDVQVCGGVRFAGATLWTDYGLFGEAARQAAMRTAADGLNDHRKISWSKVPWQRFRPQEALLLHHRSRSFLAASLAEPVPGPTVVVTHHAPHPDSVPAALQSQLLTAAYASDLSTLIARHRPALWIHGHLHVSRDYRLGDTRVLCNPHGYGAENAAFDPALIAEIGA